MSNLTLRKDAKEYMLLVIETLVEEYDFTNIIAKKIVRNSFLYSSLLRHPDIAIHDDIDTNANFIYEDYCNGVIKVM